jgi:hypothetical protein
MVAASISKGSNALFNHVDKVIADNSQYLRNNHAKFTNSDTFQSAKKAIKTHGRSWAMSALLATATYFIGRTILNAILPKPDNDADFETQAPLGSSTSAKVLMIGALTGFFKWLGR